MVCKFSEFRYGCDFVFVYIVEEIVFVAIGYMATNSVSVKDVKNANEEFRDDLLKEQETLRREITSLDKSVQPALDTFATLGNDESLQSAIKKNLQDKTKSLADKKARLAEVNDELARFRERIDLSDYQIKANIENLEYCKDSLTLDQKG